MEHSPPIIKEHYLGEITTFLSGKYNIFAFIMHFNGPTETISEKAKGAMCFFSQRAPDIYECKNINMKIIHVKKQTNPAILPVRRTF